MKLRSWMSAGIVVAGLSSIALADVTGKVKFDGKAPDRKKINMAAVAQCAAQHKTPMLEESLVVGKDNSLANVVVSLKEPPAGGKTPAEAVMLDQKGCQYHPHVVAVMTGQKILVKNSDPFLHNVHGLPEANPAFNFGQNNVDQGKPVPPMKEAEYFRIKCDVHPWMSAWMAVFNHPYFGVSGEDGTFTIKGVPDGEYEVVAWHEKLGEQEGTVKVSGGKGTVDFSFKPEEANAGQSLENVVKAVSLTTQDKECCDACEANPAQVAGAAQAAAK